MKTPRPKSPAVENLMLEHSFTKGSHYENMKGTYEVLSIDGNAMRIRWENGEESDTEVKFQDRILSRFEREVRTFRARAGARQEEGEPQMGPDFRGLLPTDFTLDVAKTTWRSRAGGIGTPVAQELETSEFCFGYWVPFRKPMIFWADVDRKNGGGANNQSGFFCRLDESRLYCGFFVERGSEADGKGDWHRFLEWLGAADQDLSLRALVAANELKIFDCGETSSFLQASPTQWSWVEEGRRSDVASLREFLSSRPAEPGTVLECATVFEKDRAVRRSVKLGRDIAQVFKLLMPLYRAALGLEPERKPTTSPRKRAAS